MHDLESEGHGATAMYKGNESNDLAFQGHAIKIEKL